MEKFILAEVEEDLETLYPYGDVSVDTYVYRIIAEVDEKGYTSIEYQSGIKRDECVEFEECEPNIDFYTNDFDVSEIRKFAEFIQIKK